MKKIVIALGGNALGKTPKSQAEIVKKTANYLATLIKNSDYALVLCHGNGPQVGMINLAFNEAHEIDPEQIPELPLYCGVSMSQGYIGCDLQNALANSLTAKQISRKVTTLITRVEVAADDPAFLNPTKPIGNFYSEEEAKALARKNDWHVGEDSGRGWRRFVSSPRPRKILELDSIRSLINDGNIVIAGGGGGVPVVLKNGAYQMINGVIDKDWTAMLLAHELQADYFIILTDVDTVSVDYKKPTEKAIREIVVEDMLKLIDSGQFGAGAMKPKVEAICTFIQKNPTKKAIIGNLNKMDQVLAGKSGTIVLP